MAQRYEKYLILLINQQEYCLFTADKYTFLMYFTADKRSL